MITVPEATKTIIMRSRYLSEAMSKGILNNSSLARYIKPEIEQMLIKNVSNSAIIMALNRMSTEIKPKYFTGNIFKTAPKIVVNSDGNEASITIFVPETAKKTPGTLYFFVKSLAWEGINVEDVKTYSDKLTMNFDKKDLNRAFDIINSLFNEVA